MNIILKCLGVILLLVLTIIVIIKSLKLSNYNPFGYEEMDLDFFGETIGILSENNINTIPIYGTLLGIMRHNSLIPWDDDIDICINRDDMGKLLSLKDILHNNGLYLVKVTYLFRPVYYKICRLSDKKIPGKNWSWPFIDIFTYTVKEDDVIINDKSKIKFPKEEIFPINKSFKIEGKVLFNLPHNPEKMLERMYGKNWKNICVSASMSHKNEKIYNNKYQIPCNNIQEKIDYGELFSNTWVINLDKDTKRWETTQQRLKQLDIIPRRWKATDSSSRECKRLYNEFKNSNIFSKLFHKISQLNILTQNEIACYLSHIKLWEKLYKKGVNNAIIFEDDIIFSSELRQKDIIDVIENSRGFDIVFLGYCGTLEINNHKPGTAFCLHAYVVSRSCLEKLMTLKTPIQKIDHFIRSFCKSNLCFLTKNVKNFEKKTYGSGLIHQDRIGFDSNLR